MTTAPLPTTSQHRLMDAWWNFVLPVCAGLLVTLSLAPVNIWPFSILAVTALGIALHLSTTVREGLWRCFYFGMGLFGSGISWIYVSIHDFGAAPPWLAGGITLLFVAGISVLFCCIPFWPYLYFFRGRQTRMLYLVLPAFWVFAEWTRTWVLTGFPWLFAGYAHLHTSLAGIAPIAGVFGISLCCALLGGSLAALLLAPKTKRWSAALFFIALCIVMFGSGAWLNTLRFTVPTGDASLIAAIVQPNIPQAMKWDKERLTMIKQTHLSLSEDLWGMNVVVWPEAAIPSLLDREEEFITQIGDTARNADSTLITGIPTREENTDNDDGNHPYRYHNSVIALGNGSGVYDKTRMVPFGEYVPMENIFGKLLEVFHLPMSSFSPGQRGQPLLQAGDYHVAPFICYEIVYPDLVAEESRDADYLVTISNDSWFGHSIGPLQHLEMAQMRALENGRYLLRGTSNGISAVIGPRGELISQSPQFTATTITGAIAPMQGQTPFQRTGSWPTLFICLLLVVIVRATPDRKTTSLHTHE